MTVFKLKNPEIKVICVTNMVTVFVIFFLIDHLKDPNRYCDNYSSGHFKF